VSPCSDEYIFSISLEYFLHQKGGKRVLLYGNFADPFGRICIPAPAGILIYSNRAGINLFNCPTKENLFFLAAAESKRRVKNSNESEKECEMYQCPVHMGPLAFLLCDHDGKLFHSSV
jgi:hypothetical protein